MKRERKRTTAPRMSKGEAQLLIQLRYQKLAPDFVQEYRFHPPRQWRFDFACPTKKLAIEIEGGHYEGDWTAQQGHWVRC